MTRVNEFGQGGEDTEGEGEAVEDKKGENGEIQENDKKAEIIENSAQKIQESESIHSID
jgi:hypothetical protein